MRRYLAATCLAGAAALALAGVCTVDLFAGKDNTAETKPAKAVEVVAASRSDSMHRLPISQVVLFNSGVGYFQRDGEVEGNTRVDLSFPVADVNDILKSLVVQDLKGGQVSAVSFDSQAPIEKTLRSFAIDLSSNPTFGSILNQARGEKIEVVLQQSNTTQPGTITGSIIGIERQKQPAGPNATVDVEQLNLWCAEGIRSVKLSDLQRVRFLNAVMDSEFKKALEVVTLSHDTQKKAVSLSFTGEGKRPVRVGYVVENPIWKTSYRLVLDKQNKPFLQGWAIVENATDDDWNSVNMALVSGRPISFQMDLYQPLYVPRPTVEPELFASLRPPTYSGAMHTNGEALSGKLGTERRKVLSDMDEKHAAEVKDRLTDKYHEAVQLQLGYRADAPRDMKRNVTFDPRQGVTSAASGQNLGDFFQYDLDHPISLARQKSALLPIVNKAIDGDRVSIYNERVHAKFPLLGLKLKNSTDLHLTQGPITVFENSTYAGDARILDLQPKEERLISYAIDLGTEVMAVPHFDNGKLTSVKIEKGIITTLTKQKESKTYTLKNRSEQDRLVLIEHPNRTDFKITSEVKPTETASDVHRFQVKAPKGETVKHTVSEERDVRYSVTLTNFDDNQIKVIINDTASSPKVKEALTKAVELKRELALTLQEIGNLNRELTVIKNEQPRLRSNLEKIPLTDPLAKRILEKLNKQEDEIEKYEADIKKLNAKADTQRKSYEGFLVSLNVE